MFQLLIIILVGWFSGMNLETAAVISELIVDRTLSELESSTDRLVNIIVAAYMYNIYSTCI